MDGEVHYIMHWPADKQARELIRAAAREMARSIGYANVRVASPSGETFDEFPTSPVVPRSDVPRSQELLAESIAAKAWEDALKPPAVTVNQRGEGSIVAMICLKTWHQELGGFQWEFHSRLDVDHVPAIDERVMLDDGREFGVEMLKWPTSESMRVVHICLGDEIVYGKHEQKSPR